MDWLNETEKNIEINFGRFEEWLGFPCDVDTDEDELSVACFHVEELYGYDGEADDMIKNTGDALRRINQIESVTVDGREYKIYFFKPVKLLF